MLTANPADIPAGGACTFQLPGDPSAASHARTLVTTTMRQLGFAANPVEDAKLAVSELATNALTHASSTARPELWIWARTHPAPEMVISIFDAHRDAWPTIRNADLLDEHGKGLSIVMALSTDTGTHPTRSRLTATPGKRVWFTLALPTAWPQAARGIAPITPGTAANRLSAALQTRGVPTTCRSDDSGISILTTQTLNIWVEPKAFSWRDGRAYTRQPLIDIPETAERIISHHEVHAPTSPTR
ncbi:ATP-binding protein [Spirillospora sp. NPDC048832]